MATFVAALTAQAKPNFVFFLVDDLGWADVGCYGSTFHETPHIDALAASGMQFMNGYAGASICSPSRAAIMTGRHPVRVDITDWIPGKKTPKGAKFQHVHDRNDLALEEVTLAEALKKNGYETFFAGKWHLGGKGGLPTDHGFDYNVGGLDKGSPPGGYYGPWKNPYLKAKKEGEYLTERLTEESVEYLKTKRNKDKPFLLYLSYYNVHTPIQPYKKRVAHYEDKLKEMGGATAKPIQEHDAWSRGAQDNPAYASMVQAVDDSVGALMAALDALDLREDTVVIFTSDNGGLCTKPKAAVTSNLPLRAGKGWLYEGGIREPFIIRAPGVTKPGSRTESLAVGMDFFPTMLDLAGFPLQPTIHNDGISLLPALQGKAMPPRTLFWHYPHYHGSNWRPGAALRSDKWKLIQHYDHGTTELYDLSADLGEQNDLSKTHPEKTQALAAQLKSWQKEIDARMPELAK
jgi:arylsulfatase A-like enzyme